MKAKKTLFIVISIAVLLSLVIIPVFAYDWPQASVDSEKFHTFFGQKRVNTICHSLIFGESEVARATDDGEIGIVITEHEDGFNWFESSLGTCVVVNHEDSLVTVYGNLDTDEFNNTLYEAPRVATGTTLAPTGNSAWQESDSYLEFQIIDTKNKNYINPLILMPRIPQKDSLNVTGISLINKFGKVYDLETQKNIPSGVYKIYKNRQSKAVPYKTTVFVNGSESEIINYDTIKELDSELAVQGRNLYSHNELYPNNDLILMGELYLPNGKDTISIIVTDFSGKEQSRVFNLTVY